MARYIPTYIIKIYEENSSSFSRYLNCFMIHPPPFLTCSLIYIKHIIYIYYNIDNYGALCNVIREASLSHFSSPKFVTLSDG